MRVLKPGDILVVIKRTVAFCPDKDDSALLEYQMLEPGFRVRYIMPVTVLIEMTDGEQLDVHVSALEILPKEENDA